MSEVAEKMKREREKRESTDTCDVCGGRLWESRKSVKLWRGTRLRSTTHRTTYANITPLTIQVCKKCQQKSRSPLWIWTGALSVIWLIILMSGSSFRLWIWLMLVAFSAVIALIAIDFDGHYAKALYKKDTNKKAAYFTARSYQQLKK